MSTTNYTPGPWEIGYVCTESEWVDIRADAATDATHIIGSTRHQPFEVNKANARLIAAAPELYEALQWLYNDTMDYIQVNNLSGAENNHGLKMARAALKKARGEA